MNSILIFLLPAFLSVLGLSSSSSSSWPLSPASGSLTKVSSVGSWRARLLDMVGDVASVDWGMCEEQGSRSAVEEGVDGYGGSIWPPEAFWDGWPGRRA